MIGHAVLAGSEVAVSDDLLMRIVATAPENAREAAFRELVQRHGDALRGFLARYVKCPAEIDDLAQEALLRVYLARERYVAGGAQFRTWLLKIARNLALDVCRRSVRRKLRALGDDDG